MSPEVSSYKEIKNYSKILPVEVCGCNQHYWRFALCYDRSFPFCLKRNPYVMKLICSNYIELFLKHFIIFLSF